MALNSIKFIQRRFLMIYVGIDVAKDKPALLQTQMVRYYSNLLPYLTIVRGLKPYFKELDPYQMI